MPGKALLLAYCACTWMVTSVSRGTSSLTCDGSAQMISVALLMVGLQYCVPFTTTFTEPSLYGKLSPRTVITLPGVTRTMPSGGADGPVRSDVMTGTMTWKATASTRFDHWPRVYTRSCRRTKGSNCQGGTPHTMCVELMELTSGVVVFPFSCRLMSGPKRAPMMVRRDW